MIRQVVMTNVPVTAMPYADAKREESWNVITRIATAIISIQLTAGT